MVNRVLIVNDSRFERLFLKDLVSNLGFEAAATDEYGSMRQVENLLPEMVIVNYTMTGMTGDELIARIKNIHPEIKCLLSSCSKLNPDRYPLVDGVLRTPVEREILDQMLHRLLDIKAELGQKAEPGFKPPASNGHFQFCPFCGQGLQLLEADIAFCPYCGQKLSSLN